MFHIYLQNFENFFTVMVDDRNSQQNMNQFTQDRVSAILLSHLNHYSNDYLFLLRNFVLITKIL